MFIEQYRSELNADTNNYPKKYITTMIKYSYIFEKDGKPYSLLVFLSFYEAYVKRIIGITLLMTIKSGITIDSEAIVQYTDKISIPEAKSCYFTLLQKWFKGEISEFIKRFLMMQVDEYNAIPYQKSTLIDKKMLKKGQCNSIEEPPFEIPTPPIVDQFFLLGDSKYIMKFVFGLD